MGLIVTPQQLKDQGEFYYQLGSMTTAGVTIVQAVEILSRSAPNRRLKNIAIQLKDGILRGQNFTEAMRAAGRHLPDFDVALIEAGEASGRLDQCFKLLGSFYDERGKMASKVISQLLYPIFMFHFALLIFPIQKLIGLVLRGEGVEFLTSKLVILLPFYAFVIFCLWALRGDRGARWRAGVETFFSFIPIVSTTRSNLALARLCAALEALINAGVMIIEAWDLAGRASGSQRLMKAIAEARPRMQAGETPGEVIDQQKVYPELFVSSYRTGEVSGQLDETLRRLYRHYLEVATTGLQRLAEWLPKLIYIGVLIAIAFQIVAFWSGHFGQMNDILNQ